MKGLQAFLQSLQCAHSAQADGRIGATRSFVISSGCTSGARPDD